MLKGKNSKTETSMLAAAVRQHSRQEARQSTFPSFLNFSVAISTSRYKSRRASSPSNDNPELLFSLITNIVSPSGNNYSGWMEKDKKPKKIFKENFRV